MKSAVKICIVAFAFISITGVGVDHHAEAGNTWGWAKPLNQKPGSLLYSTNRKNRRQTTSRRSSTYRSYHSRTYVQPKSTIIVRHPHTTVHSAPVVRSSTPTTQAPVQPVLERRVIQAPKPVEQPSQKLPSMLDGWLVP